MKGQLDSWWCMRGIVWKEPRGFMAEGTCTGYWSSGWRCLVGSEFVGLVKSNQ